MAARHFTLGHSRRPTHAEIAATPLERLSTREEAASLLQGGRAAVTARLSTPLAKAALRCQGVDPTHLCVAADRIATEKMKPQRALEHAQQVLAQVLWEEQLCLGGRDSAEKQSGTEQRDFAVSTPRHKGRGPPTNSPLSRPQSARETRTAFIAEHSDVARQNMQERVRSISHARQQRAQRLNNVQDKLYQKHQRQEEETAAFLGEQKRQLKQYARKLSSNRKRKEDQQAGRFRDDRSSFEQTRGLAEAARSSAARDKRMQKQRVYENHLSELVEETGRKKATAKEGRRDHLDSVAIGPAHLHSARELAHWQARRLEKLGAQQRDILRETLDQPTQFTHDQRYD